MVQWIDIHSRFAIECMIVCKIKGRSLHSLFNLLCQRFYYSFAGGFFASNRLVAGVSASFNTEFELNSVSSTPVIYNNYSIFLDALLFDAFLAIIQIERLSNRA